MWLLGDDICTFHEEATRLLRSRQSMQLTGCLVCSDPTAQHMTSACSLECPVSTHLRWVKIRMAASASNLVLRCMCTAVLPVFEFWQERTSPCRQSWLGKNGPQGAGLPKSQTAGLF